MSRGRILAALILTYMLFAVLLNSVGTVILQSIVTFGIDKPTASLLEACKDLTIAASSFVVASFLPALGYRRGMMLSLAIVAGACVLMPLFPGFHTTELLFVCVGASFAMTKVAVYSSIGLLTTDKAGAFAPDQPDRGTIHGRRAARRVAVQRIHRPGCPGQSLVAARVLAARCARRRRHCAARHRTAG
jgi:sugar phosphate permease